jgi:DNA-binding cell septation regulator SpoVG
MITNVRVLRITPPLKSSALAGAVVELEFDDGERLIISDVRILQDNQGQNWIALPTYSVKKPGGYAYEKTVEVSSGLQRRISDAVLAAYEAQAVRP